MAPTDQDKALAAASQVIFDKGHELQEELSELREVIDANRKMLRGFAAQGMLSDDQLEDLEELYPTVSRERRSPEERAQALREQAEDLEKAAAATNGS